MSKYIFGIVIGAIIGYITNWVAIKMLFRPYTEKRIFGVKIPFTPGLIPKEKERIAKSVGESIGTHLLTSETIIEALEDKKIKNHLKTLVDSKVSDLINSRTAVGEMIKKIMGNSAEVLKNKFKSDGAKLVQNKLSNEEFIKKVSSILFSKITNILKEKPAKLKEILDKGEIKEVISRYLVSFSKDEEVNSYIKRYMLDELTEISRRDISINEVLPKGLIGAVNVYVFNERDVIANKINAVIREETVAGAIKDTINKNILAEMSPLVSMFLNSDSLYQKFLAGVEGYLKEEENKIKLAGILGKELAGFGDKKLWQVMNNIPQNSKEELVELMADILINKVSSDEIINKGIEVAINSVDNIESYEKLLSALDNDFMNYLEGKVYEFTFATLKSNEFSNSVEEVIGSIIERIFTMHVSDILQPYDEKIREHIFSLVEVTYKSFVENEAANLIEMIDIPKIVEKQIKSFEVDYAEKIILEIASKELSAITWLGALLGGVIGILSPILGSIGQ